jgi:hypothetical protein
MTVHFYARFILKRKILLVMLVCTLAALAHAQGSNRQPRRMPPAEAETVSGSLIVARGMPALKSGDVTYFVGGINRLAGFIDELKEGAQVTIEGMVLANPKDNTFKFLRPSKLTINGKTYDMAPPMRNFGSMRPWGQMPRGNYMRNRGQQGRFDRRGSPRNR